MSTTAGAGVEVVAADTPARGDRSYLAHDGQVALVVDPQRDVDRMLDLAAARGVRITPVPETHLHRGVTTGRSALAGVAGMFAVRRLSIPVGVSKAMPLLRGERSWPRSS